MPRRTATPSPPPEGLGHGLSRGAGGRILIDRFPRRRCVPKILLVEDEQVNREMFSRRLERKGYAVLTAGEGAPHYRTNQIRLTRPRIDGPRAPELVEAGKPRGESRPIPLPRRSQ